MLPLDGLAFAFSLISLSESATENCLSLIRYAAAKLEHTFISGYLSIYQSQNLPVDEAFLAHDQGLFDVGSY
jgi:hypothetical protein